MVQGPHVAAGDPQHTGYRVTDTMIEGMCLLFTFVCTCACRIEGSGLPPGAPSEVSQVTGSSNDTGLQDLVW